MVKIPMAICYDFDGTLSPGNMQEYGFMRALGGESASDFWAESGKLAHDNKADGIAAYMCLMLEKLREKHIRPTRKAFQKFGADIEVYPGVETWFQRVNAYGKKRGVEVKHYIISSGLKEMIEGTKIGKEFQAIFASAFMYDDKGNAFWPAVVLNYTSKTQFIFRINKGCEDLNDNVTINKFIKREKRAVPFENMLYIGDGETDIPCMRMVKSEGGHAVAVYHGGEKGKRKVAALIEDGRVNVCMPADYRHRTLLEKYVFSVIDKLAADYVLKEYHTESSK